jgi:hypothetical protein
MRAGLGREAGELAGIARRDGDAQAFPGEQSGEGGAEAMPGADNQR